MDDVEPGVPEASTDLTRDLIRWAEALAGIARTGMGFTQSLYERERYEEVLHVASDMMAVAEESMEVRRERDQLVHEWLGSVGQGVAGYVTPKVAVGAVVGNENGEILLVQRADSGWWLYPTGWCDIGYSPSEVVVKEVAEETGIDCEPLGVIGVLDGMQMGARSAFYTLVFHCRATGGALKAHPLETADVGWFGPDDLPTPLAGLALWGEQAFAAINGHPVDIMWDRPRTPVWRHSHLHDE
jgi:ADP-ribose pyrophosphatase YjhB (NUDIX family)